MDIQTKVRILVQQVVEAYLQEKVQTSTEQPIAILLNYQSPNPEEILQAVSPLQESYDVTLIISKDWQSAVNKFNGSSYLLIEETTQQDLQSIIEQSSVLVVPAASYSLVSKLALTIDDEIGVWLAIQYQLIGKPIVIAQDLVTPTVYQQILAPHSVQERLQAYIRQIQADQVKWVPLNRIAETVETQVTAYKEKQSLVLAKHVEKAYKDGLKELVVPVRSKITPSAKDLSRELNIHIKHSEGGTQ